MNSKEILKARKELDKTFREEANLINGQLTSSRQIYLEKITELQKECTHFWDNGESALVPLPNGVHYCAICRKKIK